MYGFANTGNSPCHFMLGCMESLEPWLERSLPYCLGFHPFPAFSPYSMSRYQTGRAQSHILHLWRKFLVYGTISYSLVMSLIFFYVLLCMIQRHRMYSAVCETRQKSSPPKDGQFLWLKLPVRTFSKCFEFNTKLARKTGPVLMIFTRYRASGQAHRGRAETAYRQPCPSCSRQHF